MTFIEVMDYNATTKTQSICLSKEVLVQDEPYLTDQDADGFLVATFYIHFLQGVRKVMSGNTWRSERDMNFRENELWDEYVEHMSGDTVFFGDAYIILEELDEWLVLELQNLNPPAINSGDCFNL